jgi:hypothetical protein
MVGFIDERSATMGLFDAIREKATELLSGATDKLEEVTGGIPDGQEAGGLTETAAGAVSDAAGSVTDVTDTVTGSVTETAESVGEEIDPYRP